MPTLADVRRFWFEELAPSQWFEPSPALDADIRARFEPLWRRERERPLDGLLRGAIEDRLAHVLLFDQLPRNMYRDTAAAYATDALALAIARDAVARGDDASLLPAERRFLYMPYMHAESRDAQAESLRLFAALGDPDAMKWAEHHHAIVQVHGRFPHRDAILGR